MSGKPALRGIKAAGQIYALATPTEIDFKLRTFAVYVRSIARALRARYADHDGELDPGLLIDEIVNARKPANPRVKDRHDMIEQSLRRAWATERLIYRMFGPDADPEAKYDALHWLPSQAYYAIHAALDALMIAHNYETKSHSVALAFFASDISKHIPAFPLGVSCDGHPDAWTFDGFSKNPTLQNATKIANHEQGWCDHIAQGLKTTREDDCADEIETWKKKAAKKNIPKVHRHAIFGRRKKTTILHLLWRLRRRANYGDIDLFLFDDAKRKELDMFAAAMLAVSTFYIAAFEALIERRIGMNALEAMMRGFPDAKSGPVDFVAKRWQL